MAFLSTHTQYNITFCDAVRIVLVRLLSASLWTCALHIHISALCLLCMYCNLDLSIIWYIVPLLIQWLQTLLLPSSKLRSGDGRRAFTIKRAEPLVCFALSCGGRSDPAVSVTRWVLIPFILITLPILQYVFPTYLNSMSWLGESLYSKACAWGTWSIYEGFSTGKHWFPE